MARGGVPWPSRDHHVASLLVMTCFEAPRDDLFLLKHKEPDPIYDSAAGHHGLNVILYVPDRLDIEVFHQNLGDIG
jgi:hypothetical protein